MTTDDEPMPTVRSLGELAELTQRETGLHVRFSKSPEDDRRDPSKDYESGLELPGLSVNPLDPEPWWQRPLEDWLARQLCQYSHLLEDSEDERRAWVLQGREVARGPDNEPLLADFRPVAWLDGGVIDEARRRYDEAFDVGRDSS